MGIGQRAIDMRVNAYREAEPRPVDHLCGKPRGDVVGEGSVIRTVPCPTPGWWDRLWGGVQEHDVWTCKHCGCQWAWSWNSYGNRYVSDGGYGWRWRKLKDESNS